ncbi:hypothetical protein SLA2020_182330 [Shorea laevis]
MKRLFKKSLTKTDVGKRMAVPTKCLKSLPRFRGGREIDFQAEDARGQLWSFVCSIRETRHKKPVLSKGWRRFVIAKGLQVGDMVAFYKRGAEASSGSRFKIKVTREVKVFGAVFGYSKL